MNLFKIKIFKYFKNKYYLNLILIIIFLDFFSKKIIKNYLIYRKNFYVSNYFNLFYTCNYGISFGYLSYLGKNIPYILIITITIILFFLIKQFYFLKNVSIFIKIGYCFIIGGTISNLLDRIINKKIIDFIDFHINKYHYPTFNFADIFILLGTLLIIKNFIKNI
ncbi:signal peptidase II [Sodalis-like secondary symbiont of Drepanosiphum platanoidis]|uniref:signal peptidase II n=1 Tax=Sodalis-like secondary symbiont of Drepanosiphum platanoidis TaxID=2994493 RepID=UPI003463C575